MNWNNGFTAKYFCTIVDPKSWRDIDSFDITSGSISRSDSGLRESADVDCVDYRPRGEQWIRIYLDARQGGDSSRTALFTGVATSPERNYVGRLLNVPLACYSVLKASEDVLLQRGWYAPSGAYGASVIKDLLSRSTPAPIEIEENSPKLASYIIAEDSENCLSMTDKILQAIDWRIRIKGDGTIVVCSKAKTDSARFDSIVNDSIKPEVSIKDDVYDAPNIFRATMDGYSAIARDDSITSILSTVNRGREVWREESNCKLNSGESLQQYAERQLAELQKNAIEVSYSRRYNPDVLVGDIVYLNYPAQELIGNYVVISQSIALGYGAETSEEVEKA